MNKNINDIISEMPLERQMKIKERTAELVIAELRARIAELEDPVYYKTLRARITELEAKLDGSISKQYADELGRQVDELEAENERLRKTSGEG